MDDPETQNADWALRLAKKAVEGDPKVAAYWNTLGIVRYRAGDFQGAIGALQRSMELSRDGNSFNTFFLAMAHWHMGNKAEAQKWYHQALQWMEKNEPQDAEFRGFRAEAAELLNIADEKSTKKPELK